jgi:hypothetical protein
VEKTFWSCSNFFCVSNRIEIRFKSFSTPIDQYRPGCKTLSKPIVLRTMKYMTRVNAVLHCGLVRVNAVRIGSIQISIRNRNSCKNFEHIKTFFSAVSYSRNPSGIDTGNDAGLYWWKRVITVLIPYGPGSCVTALPECRPHSKLF